MTRQRPWILTGWVILGPLLGLLTGLIAGEALPHEIALGTVGGLVGGALYILVVDDDGVRTVLSAVVSATAIPETKRATTSNGTVSANR